MDALLDYGKVSIDPTTVVFQIIGLALILFVLVVIVLLVRTTKRNTEKLDELTTKISAIDKKIQE